MAVLKDRLICSAGFALIVCPLLLPVPLKSSPHSTLTARLQGMEDLTEGCVFSGAKDMEENDSEAAVHSSLKPCLILNVVKRLVFLF